MALKRKKGHFLVSKTQKTKLTSSKPDWLLATRQLFNQVVEFYVLIYNTYPDFADVPSHKVYSVIEPLTIPNKQRPDVQFPLPYNCPPLFRRAAIKKALGIFLSWRKNYQKWQQKSEKLKEKRTLKGRKLKLPKPPVLPRQYNCSPTYYKGMYKEEPGDSLVLKLWTGSSWAWVKHRYFAYALDPLWVKGSPTIVIGQRGITLNWVYEKHVPSLGKIVEQINKNGGLRLCSVDLNLDGDIAVCSILESDGTGVRELATRFVKGYSRHQHRRKRLLGKDAVAKSLTNANQTIDGMNARLWRKLKNRERYQGERVSRRIADFAHQYGATVIVFEHLTNLKPNQAKYSRRSNQKRAYWLKSKIYLRTKDKALNDYGILTVRVSPKNTSRLWAYDGTPVLRGNQVSDTGFVLTEKGMGALILSEKGEICNSDLNSARNIGLRYFSKYFEKPTLVTERFERVAMNYCGSVVPTLSKGCGYPCDLAT